MREITDNQIRETSRFCGLSRRLTGYFGDYVRLVAGSPVGTPRMSVIAAAFGVGVRQARRIMGDLAASGAIETARRFMVSGGLARQISNRYSVMLSPVAAAFTKTRETVKRAWRSEAMRRWRCSTKVVVTEEREAVKADIFVRPIAKTEISEGEKAEIECRLALRQAERSGYEVRFGLRSVRRC